MTCACVCTPSSTAASFFSTWVAQLLLHGYVETGRAKGKVVVKRIP